MSKCLVSECSYADPVDDVLWELLRDPELLGPLIERDTSELCVYANVILSRYDTPFIMQLNPLPEPDQFERIYPPELTQALSEINPEQTVLMVGININDQWSYLKRTRGELRTPKYPDLQNLNAVEKLFILRYLLDPSVRKDFVEFSRDDLTVSLSHKDSRATTAALSITGPRYSWCKDLPLCHNRGMGVRPWSTVSVW